MLHVLFCRYQTSQGKICFGVFGWGETYKKHTEGRDTEATSVANSQQNSCYRGAQERGPVSRECE